MNILVNTIIDLGGALIATENDLQALRDECYDRCHEAAANMNIYTSHALDNLSRFSEHEPAAETVREYLGDDQLGSWRAVMVMAATLATVAHLETEAEVDLTTIEKACHEATLAGYEARIPLVLVRVGRPPGRGRVAARHALHLEAPRR